MLLAWVSSVTHSFFYGFSCFDPCHLCLFLSLCFSSKVDIVNNSFLATASLDLAPSCRAIVDLLWSNSDVLFHKRRANSKYKGKGKLSNFAFRNASSKFSPEWHISFDNVIQKYKDRNLPPIVKKEVKHIMQSHSKVITERFLAGQCWGNNGVNLILG